MKKIIYGLVAAAIIVFAMPAGDAPETQTVQTQSFSAQTSSDNTEQYDIVRASAEAMETVVHITTIGAVNPQTGKFSGGTGSGYIVSDQGYIVTNCHVACGGAFITVSTENGLLQDNRADVVYASEDHDIAIIKVRNLPEQALPVATLNTQGVSRGETVYAMGAPRGLKYTLTEGTVSAIRDFADYGLTKYGYIQTDTDVNPGNSGGPLFVYRDGRMQVVGMNSFGLMPSGGSIGLNFAVNIKDVIDALASYTRGDAAYGYTTGLTVQENRAGLLVQAVSSNSPAAEAGLAPLDVITHLNGQPTSTASAFTQAMHENGNTPAVVTFKRGGDEQSVSLEAKSVWVTNPQPTPAMAYTGVSGMITVSVPDATKQKLARMLSPADVAAFDDAVVVGAIANLGPAHEALIQPLTVIYGVRFGAGEIIKAESPEHLRGLLEQAYANGDREVSVVTISLAKDGARNKVVYAERTMWLRPNPPAQS